MKRNFGYFQGQFALREWGANRSSERKGSRSLQWFEVHFLRWRRPTHLELEDESDEELKDIGIEPPTRGFDAVKPFWMPQGQA
jgi:uncharacterized protein YjiS (DUF1127 family)